MMFPRHTTIEPFAIEHATICTADADGKALHDMTIVIDDTGHIETITSNTNIGIPAHYHRIDATGKFIFPGLINLHVHLFADGRPIDPKLATPRSQQRLRTFLNTPMGHGYAMSKAKANVKTLLNSGVTTIRTLGDTGYEAVALRDRIASGSFPGPRIFASGPLLAIPEGHGAPVIALTSTTPEEARTNAETNIDHGVDVIKVAATGGVTDSQEPGEAGRPQMSVDAMRSICEAAHVSGLLVAAHAQSPQGVRNALEAGVDTIEHGSVLDDELISLFKDNPLALHGYSSLIPTLSAGLALTAIPQQVTHLTDVQYANCKQVTNGMISGARDGHMHGVVVGVGTDTAMTFVPQYATWRELYLLTHYAGFTAAEALHAATQVNARILGIENETGSITVGKSADLLVLDADPVHDLSTLASPKLVVAAGRPVWRPHVRHFDDIDALLDDKL